MDILFAIKKTIGNLLRSFFKVIFYTITFNKKMKKIYTRDLWFAKFNY